MDKKVQNLMKLEFFQNINERTLNEIMSHSEIKKYNSGHILFYDKETVNIIYFLVNGSVSLYKMNENGQKKVIFILDRGKILNDVIINDMPASINCEVISNSEILGIDKNKLMTIMKTDFELCKNIINSLSMKTRRMYRQLKNTPSSVKVEKKLAAKLYKLGRDYGIKCDDGIMINMDLTITYIADLLGSPRETVSRAMKVLQKKNLVIYENKRIKVPDLNNLTIFFKTS